MSTTPHVDRAYEDEPAHLRSRLLAMADLAEGALLEIAHALAGPGVDPGGRAIEARDRIDALESECDDLAVRLLVRRAPVGRDLREVLATLKIAAELQRVGELALHVVRRVGALRSIAAPPELIALARATADELAAAVRALRDRDATSGRELEHRDGRSDHWHRATVRRLHELARREGAQDDVLELTLACRHLERIGDHAAAVARRVVFAVEGEALPHHREVT